MVKHNIVQHLHSATLDSAKENNATKIVQNQKAQHKVVKH